MIAPPLVWIVDDDADDQYLIEDAFKQLSPPIPIKQLNDGEELLPCLQDAQTLPRLILLDLNMEHKNGFEVLAELRNIPAYQSLPIVVLTTSESEEDRRKSLKLGANGYQTKLNSQKATIHMLNQLAFDWKLSS